MLVYIYFLFMFFCSFLYFLISYFYSLSYLIFFHVLSASIAQKIIGTLILPNLAGKSMDFLVQ